MRVFTLKFKTAFLLSDFRHQHYLKILCKYLWHPLLSVLPITLYTNTLDDMAWYNMNKVKHLAIAVFTRVVPKVISNFFFACELGTADEGEYGGRWNQLLCYP